MGMKASSSVASRSITPAGPKCQCRCYWRSFVDGAGLPGTGKLSRASGSKVLLFKKKKKSCREQKNRAETQTWHCWHCCCPSPAGTVSKYRDSTTRTKNTASLSASTTFAGPLSPGNLVWYLELLCSASIDEQRARQFRAHGHSSCLAQLGGLMLVAPMLNLIRSLAMFFIFYFVMKGKRT